MNIDVDSILAPIPGENPAGEDLRYLPVYDEKKEARRADDPLDRGGWNREIKTADWDKVISLSVGALSEKTKDLQIAAWLVEALTKTYGFEGFALGLKIINHFLRDFWDNLYPEIDEGDLDYRVGPLEFLNNNLWLPIKEVPITDRSKSSGYSWVKWKESRQVGYEKDTLNPYGDADEGKKAARNDLIAEGKLSGEEFDVAVAVSSKGFYVGLDEVLALCLEEFKTFDETVDEKFGKEAPRLSELKQALEDCNLLISRILKEKRQLEPDPEPEPAADVSEGRAEGISESIEGDTGSEALFPAEAGVSAPNIMQFSTGIMTDSDVMEQTLWKDALNTLQKSGLKVALTKLLNESCSATSIRQKNRYRLLIARLCLKAERPDLARPIVEELHLLVETLNLEQWESPLWIAELLDAFYLCLTAQGASDDDHHRANNELFTRLCTKDITKAMVYNKI